MVRAREQLPTAIEKMDFSPEERAALSCGLLDEGKKEPGDKEPFAVSGVSHRRYFAIATRSVTRTMDLFAKGSPATS